MLLLALLTAGLSVVSLTREPPTRDPAGTPGVSGHPIRIDRPWWVRDLPARPGPVAGLLSRADGRWYVVGPSGRLWNLPGASKQEEYPALSDDGTHVGYLHPDGPYEIRDLVTGRRTVFSTVGNGTFDGRVEDHDRDHAFGINPQMPSFWSADGTRLLLGGHPSTGPQEDSWPVLGVDGTIRLVRPATGKQTGQPVGWTPGGGIAWLQWRYSRGDAARDVTLVTTDLSGAVLDRVPLRGLSRDATLSQWSGRLSPDGRSIAVQQMPPITFSSVDIFSARTGRRESAQPLVESVVDICLPTWAGRSVELATYAGKDADGGVPTGIALTSGRGPSLVVDPRLNSWCTLWAADALAGPADPGPVGRLLGLRTQAWTWWWKEELAALVVVLGLASAVALRWRRRRRERPRPASEAGSAAGAPGR